MSSPTHELPTEFRIAGVVEAIPYVAAVILAAALLYAQMVEPNLSAVAVGVALVAGLLFLGQRARAAHVTAGAKGLSVHTGFSEFTVPWSSVEGVWHRRRLGNGGVYVLIEPDTLLCLPLQQSLSSGAAVMADAISARALQGGAPLLPDGAVEAIADGRFAAGRVVTRWPGEPSGRPRTTSRSAWVILVACCLFNVAVLVWLAAAT